MDPSQNANGSVKADDHCGHTTHPEKDPRSRTHERIPGILRNLAETNEFPDVLGTIAEDLHLTRCAQVCVTGTEEDQAEQRDHATIDDVLGEQDMEGGGGGGDVLEEVNRDADLLEQMSLLGHPGSEKERLASLLRLPRLARVVIRRFHRNFRHLR